MKNCINMPNVLSFVIYSNSLTIITNHPPMTYSYLPFKAIKKRTDKDISKEPTTMLQVRNSLSISLKSLDLAMDLLQVLILCGYKI